MPRKTIEIVNGASRKGDGTTAQAVLNLNLAGTDDNWPKPRPPPAPTPTPIYQFPTYTSGFYPVPQPNVYIPFDPDVNRTTQMHRQMDSFKRELGEMEVMLRRNATSVEDLQRIQAMVKTAEQQYAQNIGLRQPATEQTVPISATEQTQEAAVQRQAPEPSLATEPSTSVDTVPRQELTDVSAPLPPLPGIAETSEVAESPNPARQIIFTDKTPVGTRPTQSYMEETVAPTRPQQTEITETSVGSETMESPSKVVDSMARRGYKLVTESAKKAASQLKKRLTPKKTERTLSSTGFPVPSKIPDDEVSQTVDSMERILKEKHGLSDKDIERLQKGDKEKKRKPRHVLKNRNDLILKYIRKAKSQ